LFKPKSSRAKAKNEAQLKEMRSEASDLVARMEVAAEQDAAARAEGQLAVAKLRELPDVERALCRVDLQPICLEHGLLGALATWLRPGEDGSLPNLRIRTALLGLIARLPVDTRDPDSKEQLKRSGLGKVVMFYKLHDDAAANRAQAGRIVDEWSRPLFHLSAAYRDMAKEEAEVPTGRWAEGRSVALAEPEELEQEVARLGPKDVRSLAFIPPPRASALLTPCPAVRIPPPRSHPGGCAPGLHRAPKVGGALRRAAPHVLGR
jgi:transcription factor SPN1